MLLFSKRAKYIIYTFVTDAFNKRYWRNKGIQFTKSAMITKNGSLLTPLVENQKPSQDYSSKLP